MRYYILQSSKGALIQVDSITRKTSSWSDSSIFTSLDAIEDNTTSFWGKYDPTFNTYNYTVLCCSDEKITKQSHPEFFI